MRCHLAAALVVAAVAMSPVGVVRAADGDRSAAAFIGGDGAPRQRPAISLSANELDPAKCGMQMRVCEIPSVTWWCCRLSELCGAATRKCSPR
jgi:hypothetical protein